MTLREGTQVDVEEERSGPVVLTWDPARRLARLGFAELGVGGRRHAEELSRQLDAWAGSTEPFSMLVDCSDIVDGDAGWRAVWGEWFRARREVVTLAWFDANARVRLLILMFRKGTGVHGRAFATEEEARSWLEEEALAS